MILTGCLLGKWAKQLRFNGQFRFCLRVHRCCVEFHNGSVLVMQSLPSLVCAKLDRKTEAKFLP